MNPIIFNEVYVNLCHGDFAKFKALFEQTFEEYSYKKNKNDVIKILINRANTKQYNDIKEFLEGTL